MLSLWVELQCVQDPRHQDVRMLERAVKFWQCALVVAPRIFQRVRPAVRYAQERNGRCLKAVDKSDAFDKREKDRWVASCPALHREQSILSNAKRPMLGLQLDPSVPYLFWGPAHFHLNPVKDRPDANQGAEADVERVFRGLFPRSCDRRSRALPLYPRNNERRCDNGCVHPGPDPSHQKSLSGYVDCLPRGSRLLARCKNFRADRRHANSPLIAKVRTRCTPPGGFQR